MSNDDQNLPWLGRVMTWVDRPGSARKLFVGLLCICIALVLADFLYDKHGYVQMENLPGFYAGFGFLAFCVVIFGARALRFLVKRPENYYAEKAIDCEKYPQDQLQKVEHDV